METVLEEWAKETSRIAYSDFLFKQNEDLRKQIERLQEQLNDANEALKQVYDRTLNAEEWSKHNNRLFEIANNYLEKWGLE